jgi:signal peptidase I
MKALRLLGNAALALVTVALLVGGLLLAAGQLPLRIYAVQSGSMEPDIPVKAAVLVHTERAY